mgnify:CR=1 FL=1
MNKKVLLMILDGWGIASNPKVSAVDHANTPFVDGLYSTYPHSKLDASGLAVGLPEGQMGNSEVGHMNIGAGRIVYQDLIRINLAIQHKELNENATLNEAFEYAKANHKKVHFMGLLSDGGVHSHINHLKGLCSIAHEKGVEQLFIHAFTDGRDTDPKGGKAYLEDLQNHLSQTTGQIASVIGRYYAMDRDKRWQRVKLAYDLLVKGEGKATQNIGEAVQQSYDEEVTDEFIKPIVHTNAEGAPLAVMEEGDVVLCFNFRTDRGRQITQVLTQQEFVEEGMTTLNLNYLTLTNYDDTFKNVKVLFDKPKLTNTLGEVLAKADKKQIRIAETEKYPHVTFFFSGGREEEFEGESRILCPSPKVATYDLQPEMSAADIRDAISAELKKGEVDFVCLNFANPDMVGHTGVFEAAVKACETVDQCAKVVVDAALESDYVTIIIADHGNSDIMRNPDGSPHTAHTTNLVPCILVGNDVSGMTLKDGKLGDIAPSILHLMGIENPEDMTGDNLLN